VFSLAEQIEMAIKAKPGLTPWPIERFTAGRVTAVFASSDYGSSTTRSRLTAYNGPAVLLQGSLNVAALEQSINEIRAATRSFADVLSGCGGATSAEDCFGLSVLAGSRSRGLPETKREAEVQRLGRSNTQQPFDLAQAPCCGSPCCG